MASTETALAVIESIVPVEFFKPGASLPILEKLETDVRAIAKGLDISTYEGREAIRSLAAKLATTKNGLDRAGKELVEDTKKQVKLVDKERGIVWDRVQALQDEVRKPLTDYENAEKERVEKHEQELSEMEGAGTWAQQNWQTLSVECMTDRLREIQEMKYDWQEFLARARAVAIITISQLKDAIAKRQKADDDAAELELLRAEQARRDQADREAQIAGAAREKAEAEAKAIAEQAARESQEREAAAQREAEAAVERAAQAERDLAAAEERAAREQAAAVEAARAEAEQARLAEIAATEKREANKRHCAKINNEVKAAIVALMIPEPAAKSIVEAIAKGNVPHTKISY